MSVDQPPAVLLQTLSLASDPGPRHSPSVIPELSVNTCTTQGYMISG